MVLKGFELSDDDLIEITMLFIRWYMLYRRRFPPKDAVDVKEIIGLGDQ